jgi:hypothetical protein
VIVIWRFEFSENARLDCSPARFQIAGCISHAYIKFKVQDSWHNEAKANNRNNCILPTIGKAANLQEPGEGTEY